ncbi:MAG: AAA family ATPase [Pseudonocardiaceae bacterium]
MRSVLVTGVQGVGKSTVSQLAAHALEMQNWDYADLMLRVAPSLRDKDEIRDLSWDERRNIYDQVEALLAEYFMPGDGRSECVLLENHLSILQGQRLCTFPHGDVNRYNPVALVLVEAEPQKIIERRHADTRRRRHVGTVEEITEQQALNRSEASLIGQRFKLPVSLLQNTDPSRTASELATRIAQVLS